MGTSSHSGPREMTNPPHVLRQVTRKPEDQSHEPNEKRKLRILRIELKRRELVHREAVFVPVVHPLGDTVHRVERQAQRLAHVADGAATAISDDLGRQPGPVAPVFLVDVLNDFLAALMLEVDINVRRLAPLLADESLEQDIDTVRVHRRDPQTKAHRRVRRRPATLTKDAPRTGEPNQIVHRQEIRRVVQFVDQPKLVLNLPANFLRDPVRIALGGPLPRQLTKMLHRRKSRRTNLVRILIAKLIERKPGRATRDLNRPCDRLRLVREEPRHLLRRLEVTFRVGEKPEARLVQRAAMTHTGHDIVQRRPLRNVILHVIHRNQRNAHLS